MTRERLSAVLDFMEAVHESNATIDRFPPWDVLDDFLEVMRVAQVSTEVFLTGNAGAAEWERISTAVSLMVEG